MKAMAFGTFDHVHQGHEFYLKKAKEYGYLIVVVARDETVRKVKSKPVKYREDKRLADVRRLGIADKVILGNLKDPYKIVEDYRPDVLCFGYDQKSFTKNIKEKLKERGIDVKIRRISSYKPEIFKSSKLK